MVTHEETQARMDIISAGMMKHTPEQSYTVAYRLEEWVVRAPKSPFLIWNDHTEQKILRNAFLPGDAWVRTGDLFRRDDDDYYFVDRVGDTFRWKSENVSTSEVVNALETHPGLETITVYGVVIPGQEGRAGMAAVVMQPGKTFDPLGFYQRLAWRDHFVPPIVWTAIN